jgi:hypothetical protein
MDQMKRGKALAPVDFHGQELVVVDVDGEPYVAMRPIVEGMGLDWKAQHRKLTDDVARWGVVIMTMFQSGDGKEREMMAAPLRKLAGWLMTLQPGRMKPEVAERVRLYQAECDDALWAYWSKGVAVNPRAALSRDEILLQALQSLVEKEQRIAAVEAEQAQLAGRVGAIERRAQETRRGLLALPEPAGVVAPLTVRAQVNRLVRDFCVGQGLSYGDVWRMLYREFRDRYHIDLFVRAGNADRKPLDVAEDLGEDVMRDLYGVAYDLFVARPVHVPRDE